MNSALASANPALDPQVLQAVQDSFSRQQAMGLIRATMPLVEAGLVEIHLPHWEGVQQQHGFVHGGVVGMIADSAGGYAAMTCTPLGASVLSVEYKLNFLAPAKGESLLARGCVVRHGRSLIVTQAEVLAVEKGKQTLCALMQQTIMVMQGRAEKS
ncbi:PaaI family thioesterase [Alcaligenes sp. SMD-FA]|uniref:PaaI family thioesterase n=1 Tax=Alcaligenes sp. SMD-FA TaxID=2991054 RepID=UPI0022261505|nr:PaaI family thioesterase [Alcaligenes sp. SMD-FA]UYY88700.1 PaaI family thioesterase [Alcaligenes sp. SMD-FA]